MNALRQPSKYQQDIYDFIQFETGNLFVEAVAGSGKTTSLEGICSRLTPEQLKSAIFIAFSKEIQKELSKRLPRDVWVRTFHANCLYWVRRAFNTQLPDDKWIDDDKYAKIVNDMLDRRGYPQTDRTELWEALMRCIRFARLTLVDLTDENEFQDMLVHFDISSAPNLREMTHEALEIGVARAETVIDFTDMIWLPIRLNLYLKKFALIMVDEAQDLSPCQRELLRKMTFPSTRIVAVGDRSQSIFGFAGAGVDSVDRIIEEFNCTSLPLSVCYRCHKKAIYRAKEIVPQIEPREGAPEGDEVFMAYEEIFRYVDPQREDLVICRTNGPLVNLAFALIGAGIPATIKGRDLMGQLINLAKSVLKLPGANWEQFQSFLQMYVERQVEAMARREKQGPKIQALRDRADALSIIVSRAQALDHRISTINGLESFIERLYGEERGAVLLCSAHKAKGLEADRVFILGYNELMPHPMAKAGWELVQEYNLKYVALTRSKTFTGYVALPPKEEN